MQLNPFPWQLTQECLKSLLRYAFDMKEFHHCMHVYGGTLFNYWRHYLHEHCSDDKMKDVIEKCLFANHASVIALYGCCEKIIDG